MGHGLCSEYFFGTLTTRKLGVGIARGYSAERFQQPRHRISMFFYAAPRGVTLGLLDQRVIVNDIVKPIFNFLRGCGRLAKTSIF